MNEPATPEEWQSAVDAAEGALALDSARQYGLITGGPTFDTDRCIDLLRRGEALGILPRPDAAEEIVRELVQAGLVADGRCGERCATKAGLCRIRQKKKRCRWHGRSREVG